MQNQGTLRRTAAGMLMGISVAIAPAMCLADNSAAIQSASTQVHEAQMAVDQARGQMAGIRARIAARVRGKPEYVAIIKEFKNAQTAFAAIQKQALANLRKRPEYQALQAARQQDRDLLSRADNPDSRVSDAQIRTATDDLMQSGLQLRKMRDNAFDHEAGYSDAKNRLDAAQSQMDQIDAEITQEAQSDPQYQDVAKTLSGAEQRLSSARGQLAQAVKADQQQREQEAKAREQQNSFGQ